MTQPWGQLERTDHEVVLGVPQSGKTTLARGRLASARRAVFFDPTGDFVSEGERVPAACFAVELLRGTVVRWVVEPGADVAADFERVTEVCRAAKAFGGLVLCADEVGDYSRSAVAALERLHRNGHHDGVASVLVTPFAVDIPKNARRSASRVWSCLQEDPEDLQALAEVYGEDFAARVRAWRPGDEPAMWERRTLFNSR